jgi:RNA-directed DNA polymerase
MLIKFRFGPYDISLKAYYKQRDEKEFNRNCIKSKQKMAKTQKYKCPICKMSITDFRDMLEVQEKLPIAHGGTQKYNNLQLVHDYCNKQYYKMLPLKGELPTIRQKQECYKTIRNSRIAVMP